MTDLRYAQSQQADTDTGGRVDSLVLQPWPPRDEVDGETDALIWIVDHGWDWNWPGWQWVASRLNREYENNRTAAACRSKYKRLQ